MPTEGGAAGLIASPITSASSDNVVVVTLGPTTNLAEALEQQPAIATRITRLFIECDVQLYGSAPGAALKLFADARARKPSFRRCRVACI